MPIKKYILAGFLAVACFTAPAFAESILNGWGNLKFGMSVEKAREVEPHLDSDAMRARDKHWHPYSVHSEKPTVTQWDGQFYLMTRYDEDKALYEIELERDTPDAPSLT